MKWLGVVVGILLLALLLLFLGVLRRSTVYYFTGGGFVAFGSGDLPIHESDEAGLLKAVKRLLVGDLYDYLWVSHRRDPYGGVSTMYSAGGVTASASFKTHAQADEIVAFRKALLKFGYPCDEDSAGFNGGTTEDHRETNFDFKLPNDATKIVAFLKAALAEREETSSVFCLSATTLATSAGTQGIRIERHTDPLAEVLRN